MLCFHEMTEAEKYIASDWKYEGKYTIYNNIPYEEQKKKGKGFANPKKNSFAFCDEDTLVGFIKLYEEEKSVFLGIGVNPLCCGQGYGTQMLLQIETVVKELFGGKKLYLEVRTWNKRAIHCYQKAGFQIVGDAFKQNVHLGEDEYYRMEKEN